jgi:hypothetical protein
MKKKPRQLLMSPGLVLAAFCIKIKIAGIIYLSEISILGGGIQTLLIFG